MHTHNNTFLFLLPCRLKKDEDGASLGYVVSDLLLKSKLHSNQLHALFYITVLPPNPCSSTVSELGTVQYVERP